MAENIETTSVVWKQIADQWSVCFTPPSRISPGEVEQYREWLKELNPARKPLKALVLGATPELRDALCEAGYKTTIIDINLEMILAMNSLLKSKNPGEIIVRANWLDNPLQSGYFDVVLGDAVLPNIPFTEREKLLSEASRLLKPGGVFLTRAFNVPRKNTFKNMDELLAHFSAKEPTYRTSLELVLELQILAYDQKDHLGSFLKAKQLLEKIHAEKGFDSGSEKLDKTLGMVWDFWCNKFVGKVFIYVYRDEEEKEYKKFFEIKESFESKDNEYSKITPMYVLKKKSR
ncbi:MAG: class I SAM-dependent methyltransferase [Candidatus Diapherotrites archaeon]|nr:class I SAM-dependent methyltransferase [Candidatus Diapherotrites archaeon]